jgi:hypothetical protein
MPPKSMAVIQCREATSCAAPQKTVQHLMEPEGSSPHSQEISSNSPRLDHSYYTWGRVQVMKFFIMPPSCHIIPPRPKYSPQHPTLEHPQSMFHRYVRDQVSYPYRTSLLYSNVYVLRQVTRRQKNILTEW